MNRKQKIIVSVTGIFLVLLILVGLTYAYYLTRIVGNTNDKSISLTTANLELVYGDGTTELLTSDTKLVPSADPINTKDFTVTNNGDDTNYAVIIENIVIKNATTGDETTFESNDFVYTLSCEKSDGSECNGVATQTTLPMTDSILVEDFIEAEDTHTYVLTLWYLETGVDQSADMNKTFEARINIEGKEDIEEESNINPYSDNTNSLAYNIINNAINVTEEQNTLGYAIYSATPLTTPAEEVSGENESTLSMTPDDYTATTKINSYYYRGNVTVNYVNFADMCWRIVRVEGDGSIKLILEDQDNTCETANGNWNIPTETGGTTLTGNFGYTMYAVGTLTASDGSTTNTSTKYVMDYLHGTTNTSASMATTFKNFQSTFTETELSKLKSGNWCLGDAGYSRTGSSNSDYTYTLLNETQMSDYKVKGTSFYYDSYVRLSGANKDGFQPTLKCNGTIMNDWEDDSTNSTPMYVGTITADEITYAGGKISSANQNYYLINNYQNSSEIYFWSLSPEEFMANFDPVFIVNNNGYVLSDGAHYDYALRPSVSLIAGTEISGGIGTIDEPYKVS